MGATIGFAAGITLAVSELLAAVNNIAIVADELQQFQGTWVCGAMLFLTEKLRLCASIIACCSLPFAS